MGALNVSPESFHAGSVHTESTDLVAAALAMVDAGASLIDVGARSTAPYGASSVSDDDERERLARAIEALAAKVPVPISADTARPGPARAALDAGARVINDITGLHDPEVAALIRDRAAGAILMAFPKSAPSELEPVASVRTLLEDALARARGAGIPDERVVLDPGIGFFRAERLAWDEWDATVLAGLGELDALGRPLCVGVSRKSFLGAIIGRPRPEDRLAGSLAAAAVAVWNGASLIRAHDVAETLDAVRVVERIRRAGGTL
jgi:dihydropteroate synthase